MTRDEMLARVLVLNDCKVNTGALADIAAHDEELRAWMSRAVEMLDRWCLRQHEDSSIDYRTCCGNPSFVPHEKDCPVGELIEAHRAINLQPYSCCMGIGAHKNTCFLHTLHTRS